MAQILEQFEAFIIDLDGVVYLLSDPVPGSPETIRRLKALKKPFVFLTNNSSPTPEQYVDKLRGFGIDVEPDQIVTSSQAVGEYLRNDKLSLAKKAFVVGEEGLRREVERIGISLVSGKEAEKADIVVVGSDRNFDYEKMKTAVIAIRNGADYIASNVDSTYPTPDGLWPGAGALVASITVGSGKKPYVAGKPNRLIVELALKRLAVSGERVLLVGDRLDTDISAGRSAGVRTALVLSGVSKLEDVEKAGIRPDYVTRNLASLFE